MKNLFVKDVMVPLKDYATVSEDATLFDAVIALETAQREFDQSRYRHRAVLVFDKTGKIVGKVSQFDILKALEPHYQVVDLEKLSRFGYSLQYLATIAKTPLWDKPLSDLCKKAGTLVVKDFMNAPTPGEFIDMDKTLDEGIHQLIVGNHQSLLVTQGADIVGILRVTDVFAMVCDSIKACDLQ